MGLRRHESEVPQPGDYVTRQIGMQPVIVSRDDAGKVHLLLNRCTHRGNTICQSERGNSHAFRCAYHGWTFNSRGDLVGVPYAAGYGATFRKDEFPLAKVCRVGSYRGLIFASLSADGPSLEDRLGPARALLDQFVDLRPKAKLSCALACLSIRTVATGRWRSKTRLTATIPTSSIMRRW